MKMTAVNSAVDSNPFEVLNESLKAIYGEEYFNSHMKVMEGFSRVAYTACEQNEQSKEIEEVYPALGIMYQDLDVFAKIWLINETQSCNVNYTDVLTFIMSDGDRFMLNNFGYNFWKPSDLTVKLIDGIPDTIHGDSRLIAKKIIKNRLSNEESQKLNTLTKKFKNDMSKYHELISFSTYGKEYINSKPSNWAGWNGVHEARMSGWFPFMGEATEAEIEFCKKNGIPISAVPEQHKQPRRHSEEEINAGMAKALSDLIGQINGTQDVNTNDPEPDEKPEIKNAQDVFVIDMKMIEDTVTAAGDYFNNHGGLKSLIDELSSENDDEAAAFSMGTVIKTIFDSGKVVVPKLIGILGPVIDFAAGAFKKGIINKPEAMPEKIKEIIPENTQIAIDSGVDKIKGLADLLRGIIAELCIIRDSNDVDTQIDAIDRIAELLKKNVSMFNDEKFMKLIDRFMGNMFDLADQAGISSDRAQEVVQNDEGVATMLPATVMPAVANAEAQDDGMPYWMKAIGDITSAMRQERGKSKPGFIEQANNDAKAAAMANRDVIQQQLDALTPNFKVDPALSKAYPWVNQICGIAVKNGIAVSATPFYNARPDGGMDITSIRIESFVDGIPSKEKSFSIDLGYFLDRRVKMVFNYGINGFGFMEACDDAYFVFDRNSEKQQVVDTKIFEAIFKFGISSIKEDEKRNMRMYNSNTTKVNRTIVWITVPTWAVKGEERKALKDSVFKMEKTIRAIAKENDMSFGRFALYGFDPNTLSYTLDNAGVYYKGQLLNVPHILFNVTIAKDANGNIRKDDDGHAELSCTISYADNVFGPEGPKFPNDTTVICGSPEQNTDLFTTGIDPTSEIVGDEEQTSIVEVINPEEEGTTPAVILDPEKVEEKKPKRGSRKNKTEKANA